MEASPYPSALRTLGRAEASFVVPLIMSTTAITGQLSCEFLWGHLGKSTTF